MGEDVMQREKERREERWVKIEKKFENGERVDGVILNKVKGGLKVEIDGDVELMKRRKVDISKIREVKKIMKVKKKFEIIKMEKRRGKIVVQRSKVIEERSEEKSQEIVKKIEEGKVVEGVVKKIKD